jgi:LssY C-terminus
VLNAPYPTPSIFSGVARTSVFKRKSITARGKRHHIRFWALSQKRARATWGTADFWLNTERPPDNESVFWIGAGTKDTGLSLTRLSVQITHATDSDTNAERDYIVGELRKNRSIEAVKVYKAGENLLAERVNHCIADGEITLAVLAANSH